MVTKIIINGEKEISVDESTEFPILYTFAEQTYESPVTTTPFKSTIKTASSGLSGTSHYMWTANKADPCRTVLYTTQGQIVTVDSCDRGGRTRPFIKGNFEVK